MGVAWLERRLHLHDLPKGDGLRSWFRRKIRTVELQRTVVQDRRNDEVLSTRVEIPGRCQQQVNDLD